MKDKQLVSKQKERFLNNLLACLPELTDEQVAFYSLKKNQKYLRRKLSVLDSALPVEEERYHRSLGMLLNQEAEDIQRFVEFVDSQMK